MQVRGRAATKGRAGGAAASSRRAQAWECEVTWLRDGVSGDGDLPTVQVLDGLGEAQQRLLQAAVGEVGGRIAHHKKKVRDGRRRRGRRAEREEA